jgi:hypothetical protein
MKEARALITTQGGERAPRPKNDLAQRVGRNVGERNFPSGRPSSRSDAGAW